MKRLFILICLIVFALPCFADYIPIPKEKSAAYKSEIEKAIVDEISRVYKETSRTYKEAYQTYLEVSKKPCDKELRAKYIKDIDSDFDSPQFFLYYHLIEITQKYVDIKKEIPNTRNSQVLAEFISPYFEDNKVNNSILSQYKKYEKEQEEKIHNLFNSLPIDNSN